MQSPLPLDLTTGNESSKSGVSWPAVIAGAVVATAIMLMLLAFGSGIGFASMSPWRGEGVSAKGATLMAAVWLIIVQWVSAGMGGYLTGRLRCKWVGVHSHEVFFRDTAHGFLAWALATVVGIGLLSAGASHMAASAADSYHESSHVSAMPPSGDLDPLAYYVDTLFRVNKLNTNAADKDSRAESERILITGIKNGAMSDADRNYLSKLVQPRTGLSQADADKRINDVLAQEKQDEDKALQMADAARKAAAGFAVYAFLSMLIGAFISCVAAALGGNHRDEGWGYTNTPTKAV